LPCRDAGNIANIVIAAGRTGRDIVGREIMRIAVVAVALLLAGCASGPSVRALADPQANFSAYRSFGFASPLGTDRGGYQSVVSDALKNAARRELTARGLTESASPDLIVNFNAQLADKTRVTTTPAPTMGVGIGMGRYPWGPGYYGYRAGLYAPFPLYQDQTTVTQYKEGTLNIDIADVAKKQLVWEGVVVGKVSGKALDNVSAAIDSAVTQAFAKYPVPAAPR
jgi:hypothetical protein